MFLGRWRRLENGVEPESCGDDELTGSCLQGRESFVKDHRVDLDKRYTVAEFVEITKNAYRGDVVRKLVKE